MPAGGGGDRGARQAHALSPLPAPLAGRGSPAPAASGDRAASREAGRDRVSAAPVGLPRLWGADPRRRARGVPTGGFGPRVQAIVALCTGAYHLSKRTTQEVLADLFGLPMRLGTIATSGAGHGAGGGRARGRGPDVCPHATGRAPGRDRLARRTHAGLAVGRGDRVGHRLCGPPVAWGQGGPGALGGAVLGHVGDGSLERLHLVSDAVAAGLLGASAARL